MISESSPVGGGDWSIYGLQDQDSVIVYARTRDHSGVKMYGYNYDELDSWATKLKRGSYCLIAVSGSYGRFQFLVVEG